MREQREDLIDNVDISSMIAAVGTFMDKIKARVVVLAAGKGKRMASATPKVLMPVGEKTMVKSLIEAIAKAGVDARPVVIVSPEGDDVRRELGENCEYIVQTEQLGTGHAVACAEKALKGSVDTVLVLYGDHPCEQASTIRRMFEMHANEKPTITMATTTVPDFEDWRKPLEDFGRVIRDASGKMVASIEKRDATPEQLAIKELNPCFYCFDADWLWDALRKVGNQNAQKEYYLTDLVQIAIDSGKRVMTVDVDPRETLGVNTPEHLELIRKIVKDSGPQAGAQPSTI